MHLASQSKQHEHDVLAGRAGGQIQSGRHIVYPKSTPLADLYLSTLRMMGVKADSFADAQGPLAGLGDANFTGQYGFQQIDGR